MTNLLLDLFKYLKEIPGVDVFFTGQHNGLVDKPSLVIIPGVQIPQMGTNKAIAQGIDIRVMVNIDSYIEIERVKRLVIEHMRKHRDFNKTGYESPVLINDEKKAYYGDIEYSILKELN